MGSLRWQVTDPLKPIVTPVQFLLGGRRWRAQVCSTGEYMLEQAGTEIPRFLRCSLREYIYNLPPLSSSRSALGVKVDQFELMSIATDA